MTVESLEAWTKANPDRVKEYRKNWQKANRKKCLEYERTYNLKHKEKIKQKNSTPEQKLKRKIISARYRKNHPEKVKQTTKAYREKTKTTRWKNRILQSAKSRAKERNYEFDLTVKDFTVPDFCPVLGTPLLFTGSRDNRPSLDRLDNSKGYTKDNVRVISMRANRFKSDASLEELEKLVAYIKANS